MVIMEEAKDDDMEQGGKETGGEGCGGTGTDAGGVGGSATAGGGGDSGFTGVGLLLLFGGGGGGVDSLGLVIWSCCWSCWMRFSCIICWCWRV